LNEKRAKATVIEAGIQIPHVPFIAFPEASGELIVLATA
jgi:hypothetical protein